MRGQQEMPQDVPDCDTHIKMQEVEYRRHLLPPFGGAVQREVPNPLHIILQQYLQSNTIFYYQFKVRKSVHITQFK